jgi:hypothetical protein
MGIPASGGLFVRCGKPALRGFRFPWRGSQAAVIPAREPRPIRRGRAGELRWQVTAPDNFIQFASTALDLLLIADP